MGRMDGESTAAARRSGLLTARAGVLMLAMAVAVSTGEDVRGHAEDVTVAGRRIAVRTVGRNRVKLVIRDEAVLLLDDPRTLPSVLVVSAAGTAPGSTGVIELDPSKWSARGASRLRGYKYKDRRASRGGVTAISWKAGRLAVKARGKNWSWVPAGGLDSVRVQFRVWKRQLCAEFGGKVTKNRPGIFKAKQAPAPTSCPALVPVDDDAFSAELFATPPREFRPSVRWWWPGGGIDDETVRAQLAALADAGFGAVEIQPLTLGITNADLAADPTIRSVGEPAYLARVANAGCEARALGLAWDVTLGSGWSNGGPNIDEEGERQLLSASTTVVGPSLFDGAVPEPVQPSWVALINSFLPALDGFDANHSLVAALAMEVLDGSASPPILGAGIDLMPLISGDRLTWNVPAGIHEIVAFYENKTLHFPAGNAYPGTKEDARIVDHLDRRGIDAILAQQGTPWLAQFADCPPRSVFVDSFELIGELPWTTALPTHFAAQFGYDVVPYLPFLFRQGGESEYTTILTGETPPRYATPDLTGLRAREDYETLRARLFLEEFVEPLSEWASNNAVDFRLQAHGGFADVLDAYGVSDVPESEGLYAGGSYDFLKLAASAAHVAGRRHVSSETFVAVSPGGADFLALDQFWLLAGRAYSAGINRVMYHGAPYPFVHTDGTRWFPFDPIADNSFPLSPFTITSDLHADSAIWPELPALNQALQRLSYALSRGTHVADVAWLKPDRVAHNFVNFVAETAQPRANESELGAAIRRAGYAYDRISSSALVASTAVGGELRVGEATYRALVIDGLDVAEPEWLAAIDAAHAAGVPVVWLGGFPDRAPGLVDPVARDAAVVAGAASLTAKVQVAATVADVPVAIRSAGVTPAVEAVGASELAISIERRRVTDGEIYLLFNESYAPVAATVTLAAEFSDAQILDPESGAATPAAVVGDQLGVSLPAARGRILWLRPAPDEPTNAPSAAQNTPGNTR